MAEGTTKLSSAGAQDEAHDSDRGSEKSDAELLRIFVGPNADKFLKIYHAQRNGKHAFSFNWVVMLAALPWLFYRKLYVVGVCLLLIPIIVVVIFPNLSGVGTTGFAGAMAVLANMLYVQIALRRIRKLKALNLPPAERDDRIRKAGGTSPAGAVFGTLITVSLIALIVIDPASAKLPDCSNAQVQDLAKSILTDGLSKDGMDPDALTLSDFKVVESAEDGSRHLCSFSAELGTDSATLYLAVTWKDGTSEEIQVSVGPTQDAVSH